MSVGRASYAELEALVGERRALEPSSRRWSPIYVRRSASLSCG